jgi:hypothetical protein
MIQDESANSGDPNNFPNGEFADQSVKNGLVINLFQAAVREGHA